MAKRKSPAKKSGSPARRAQTRKKVAEEVGLAAALVGAIAGAYFLYGSKEATKRRKQIKGWTLKAKGECLEKLEKLDQVNEKAYHNVVDTVASKYKKLKHVSNREVDLMVKELKSHWKHIQKEVAGKNAPKKRVPKRKPARKTATKKTAAKRTSAKKPSGKKRTLRK